MKDIIKGMVYVLGDNIDTDQIIPARYLVYSLNDPEERKNYGRYALSGVPPSVAGLPEGGKRFVEEGEDRSRYSIIVAGKNFGCGSSREHAPVALHLAGVRAVVAESYSRIFYRNVVDGGFFLPLESRERLIDCIKTGDEVTIDLNRYVIKNLRDNKEYALVPLGDVKEILMAGGIFSYVKKAGIKV